MHNRVRRDTPKSPAWDRLMRLRSQAPLRVARSASACVAVPQIATSVRPGAALMSSMPRLVAASANVFRDLAGRVAEGQGDAEGNEVLAEVGGSDQ